MNDATLRIASLPWWGACPSPYRPFLSRSSLIFTEWRDALWQQRVWNCFLDCPKICFTALLDWFRNLIPPLVILEDSTESGYFKTKFACSLIDCASGLRKKKRKVLWIIAPCRLPHPPNPPTPPHPTPPHPHFLTGFPDVSPVLIYIHETGETSKSKVFCSRTKHNDASMVKPEPLNLYT